MLPCRKGVANQPFSKSAENLAGPVKLERRCDKVQDIEFLIEDHSDGRQGGQGGQGDLFLEETREHQENRTGDTALYGL